MLPTIPFPPMPEGTELYLAGGCVRDVLLGLPFKDRDFVIMTPLSFQEVCDWINAQPDSKVYLAKPEFMTIRCRIAGQDVDITWPRREGGYSDGRHPDSVEAINDLKEDALRRDFTVNAMYLTATGHLLDFFEGESDLYERILKCPQPDARKTFKDDYLRIFRLIRFSVTKGFSIDRQTLWAAIEGCEYLSDVPFERIRDELNKALKHNAFRTFQLLSQFVLFEILRDKGLTFQLTAKDM